MLLHLNRVEALLDESFFEVDALEHQVINLRWVVRLWGGQTFLVRERGLWSRLRGGLPGRRFIAAKLDCLVNGFFLDVEESRSLLHGSLRTLLSVSLHRKDPRLITFLGLLSNSHG